MPANETIPTAGAASPRPQNHPLPTTVYLRSLSKTSSTPVIDTTSTDYECYKFEGQEFGFPDQSRWLISKLLSDVAIRQTCPPCEARQVFTAIRTAYPRGFYIGIKEAVIKAKYQIRLSRVTVQRFKSALANYKNDLIHHTHEHQEIWRAINQAEEGIYACTHPVIEPNEDTFQEGIALGRLVDMQCENAPHLFKLLETKVQPGMHEDGIVGGYVYMLLMRKMPGARLPYNTFSTMSRAQRDNVREAFRKALDKVWACGVIPNDKALRNIVWDGAEQKCYIVDFEDCRIIDLEKQKPPEFKDREFEYWDLDEESVQQHCRLELRLTDDD